jgi:hypothetical protein
LLTAEQLKQVAHQPGLTRTDSALLCVAAGGGSDVPTAMVRKLAIAAGVKGAKTINFSAYLSAAEDKVFKTPSSWELTGVGREHVAALAGRILSSSPAAAQAESLRALLPQLSNEDARAFLTEAIVCAEQSLHRAAVVLAWVGAIALLHDAAVSTCLPAINAEAVKRDQKWKLAKTTDDLGRLKEATFLEIAQTVGLIGKNLKQELDVCLKLRNACGHPNSLKVGPNKVASHLETLALNIYSVYT